MFRGGQPNPYDEIVGKTTDENLTGENWELILNLCDKVQDEGEQGARNVTASVLKRLAHRNPNVQLYTLTLAEALSKNCGIEVHREVASRAFTQGLEKLVTDRTTHDKVRRRTLALVAQWTSDFEKDPTLGIMEECYESLKSKGYKFEAPDEAPPLEVDDEVRRREEEELQRVLEMSMHDKGGRAQWEQYSLAASGGAGGSGSHSGTAPSVKPPSASPAPSTVTHRQGSYAQQPVYGGYVPSASPAISASAEPSQSSSSAVTSVTTTSVSTGSPVSTHSTQDGIPVVTRVRALHAFEPTEPGELPFEKGDIIKVVDRGYKDWWRGQLKGRTGIFPVNYVEPLPEPTPAELAKEAEQEASVFSQAANVDRLLTMLRAMDPVKDNLADNEEIQELYRSCMTLRPRIVKLIDKYSQKRAELVAMNESFVKARTIFDRMMEDSLARHTGIYDGRGPYPQVQPYIPRPDSRARQDGPAPGGPQAYGWNPALYDQPGYNAYPAPVAAYNPGPESGYPGPAPQQPFVDPNAYAQRRQSMYPQQSSYPGQPGAPNPYLQQEQQAYPSAQPAVQPQTTPHPQGIMPPQHEPTPQAQPVMQPQVQAQSPQAQQQPSQQQAAPHPSQGGPPYIFDPNTTYTDPNVQAWAQYYAQGGKDPTGAVYFLTVPGIKEGPAPVQPARNASQETVQPQQQPHSPVVEATQPASTAPLHSFPQQQQGQAGPESALAGALGSAPPLVQRIPEQGSQPQVSPISPTAQAAQPQFYQAPGSSPNSSFHSTTMPQQQQQPSQEAYGASPYAPTGYPQQASSPPAGDAPPSQQGWQQQYYSLPNQFAGMEVSGEGHQSAGPQGVGAPA
ncbi:hypothetical protein CERSUDRAFT_81790 [Gelatoporia subvermispora B]|uniref:Class E vacuolar protein-sorting machinery protein HSE1 n=1 Tax=Ceriporiopsis subvermispora (strain B) TaxID=914234 RepID=M2RJN5_CERS8|nr:hypothetical protein CERSUDRAFT_81790 [Gelatoporia subvermispora B]